MEDEKDSPTQEKKDEDASELQTTEEAPAQEQTTETAEQSAAVAQAAEGGPVDVLLTETTQPPEQQTEEMADEEKAGEEVTEQKPAEDVTEQKPAENTAEQKPAEDVAGQKPAEDAVEQKPAEDAAEQKPAEDAAEQKPAEDAAEQKPAENAAEQKPVEDAAEQKQAEDAVEQKPAEDAAEQKPAEDAAEQKPAEDAAEQKPAEDAAEQKPAEDAAEQKPAEDAAEQNPAEDAAEQKPAEAVDGTDPNIRGDEDEVVSEQADSGDKNEKIPDDFYYDFEDHASKPHITEESGLPIDLLKFHHSFGYDCQKRANLHMLDNDTALFAAGNVIQLLNLRTKEHTYLRSTSGGGIGAIAVHPSNKYFAVAEKGSAPNVNIFEFPSLKLCRILRGGTEETYAFVDFSPDGKLLASVGGAPDYMLTLWDWKQEQTVLRSKAFSQDVFRVTFSTELEGQLTSSGTGHVRFWKMARTFTGLKLQGQLGKFGKTEISDIEGYVELPDGKVLSGCETGNLLLWEGGLIKVEISRKGRKSCHHGAIEQIVMDEGELMTIGEDGFIRVWDFETIDTADITDESSIFEMEPMNELKVGSDVKLRSIVKSCDQEEPTMWYAQDANGGIWKLDLSFSFTSQEPEKLSQFHSGVINGCSTSPVSDLVATIGIDRRVYVYDYLTKTQICHSKFNTAGTSLLWCPALVDPKGSSILAGFEDGVVRVLNFQKDETVDIHGKKKEDHSELALKQAFKPHNGAVTCMCLDSKGELLATGSSDHTVFFFNVGDTYTPIGFIKTPSAVTSMTWSPERFKKSTLLATCQDGQAFEIESPGDATYDTSHTFEITGLKVRTHVFKSVKSHLRHEEELERKEKEEEEEKKRKEAERKIRIDRGLETESEHGDEEEEQKEPEAEWEAFIPETPSALVYGLHGKEEGKVWVSAADFDAGYLYEVEFKQEEEKEFIAPTQLYHPTRTVPIHDSHDVPITCLQFTKNGKYLLMGMQDGAIRIQQVEEDDVGQMSAHWAINAHDNHYGHVSHIALSHDDRHLFTVGGDGNFFVYELMEQAEIEERVKEAKAKIPSARPELKDQKIDDIDDPQAYSIEDAKQKSEYDKMMKLAEEKKKSVRHTIHGFRDQFKKLIEQNHELPAHLRLDRKEFEMDPEIKRQLEQQTEQKIEQVKKEMAWEEEKHRIALHKLTTRFKAVVECERIVVKSFNTVHEVSSYRASNLPDDFYQAKSDMDRRRTTNISNYDMSKQSHDRLTGKGEGNGEGQDAGREDTAAPITTTLKGSMGERITKALQKVEEKKKRRNHRRAQWAELNADKPDDNYEAEEDVLAIKEAQENMGDYKLKSADDYVVPDHLRMNTVKARSRLLQLKDLLHQHKYDFNQRLLALRDKKIGLIDEIKAMRKQLVCVQEKLGDAHTLPLPEVPRMHVEELPEKKFEYTRETLLKFKAEYDERQKTAGKAPRQSGFGGFGGAPAEKSQPLITPNPTKKGAEKAAVGVEDASPHADEPLVTALEQRLQEAQQIKLLYERDRLFRAINEMLSNFDAELRCLRHEKFKLDIDLKNADLRHVTLFEEFLLLKDFEKHEDELESKVESKQQEKTDMQNKILEVQAKLEAKKKDIEKLQEKEKALQTTFVASLGDNNKFVDYLTKVFKKKIKRSKKKPTDGEDEDEDSEEESSDESDMSDSEDESDSELGGYDLDVCPPGCDQNIYDNSCQLREKRLDIEEALAEEKKNRETLSKELDSLNKKSKIIDSGLKTAENELEAFQLEKQQKLNELDVVVTLKLHQLQHTLNGTVPQDLSQCLVFEQPGVVRLTHRIKELEHEKALQKKQMREAKKKHVQLIKDRRVFEAKIGEMNEQCNKMMVAKFGRIVDLEKIETVTVNRQIEELKDKIRVAEVQCSNEVSKWDDKIATTKDEITNRIRQNTNRLDQLNMLLSEKKDYEKELDSRQKSLGDEYGGVRKADVHERQRLIQLVHLQAQEIEALKEEINLLSRKGGHILPPAQAPLPHSAQARGVPLPPP